MSNLDITNVDTGSVELRDGEFRDDILTFTGADSYPAGTILSRLTATSKLVAFVKAGSLGTETPVAVMVSGVTVTGAGDENIRVLVSGVVNKDRLIIDLDGDASNIDSVVTDKLRHFGIVPIDVEQLAELDNQ